MSRINKRIGYDPMAKSREGRVCYYDGRKPLHNLGAGDMYYIPNFVKSRRKKDRIFSTLLQEVDFQQMFNFVDNTVEPIPRMISAQTEKKGSVSLIYRMPGCNESNIPTTDWSPTVKGLIDDVSLEIDQTLNHCVLTLFRDSDDSLAFHQDKVMDLEEGSNIVSLSFGEPRPIVFEEIDGKKSITIILQPGSILVFDSKTNSRYRHSIPKLNQPIGPRISLSIRTIRTLIEQIDKETFMIRGKGEEYQTKNYPFIKSHDDSSQYTDEIKRNIETLHAESQQNLEIMRSGFGSEDSQTLNL